MEKEMVEEALMEDQEELEGVRLVLWESETFLADKRKWEEGTLQPLGLGSNQGDQLVQWEEQRNHLKVLIL